jgi:ubiquinone/menaquinone biosynthesis C-methylase UbiE
LKLLLELENRLYVLEGEASVAYGNGIHTKHRHINYHQFFIKNLRPGERVLDIGCGNGFLSYDMVTQVPGVKVVGIELSEANIKFACEHYQHPNLQFIHGDALKLLPHESFDVVTLSNVLEHIEHRVEFLKQIMRQIKPRRLILRVPLFERDWRVPLKKELGIDYRLDATHCIEYTQEDFFAELQLAGLKATHNEFRWGEIWSVAEPIYNGENVDT